MTSYQISISQSPIRLIDNAIQLPLPQNEEEGIEIMAKSRKHILLVKDNQELRTFLKQAFEKHYHVYEAEDGNAGMQVATEKVPDMIISDVIMPGMNGIELCKLVKNTFETVTSLL